MAASERWFGSRGSFPEAGLAGRRLASRVSRRKVGFVVGWCMVNAGEALPLAKEARHETRR
jgi:hypothetical protein